MTGQAGHIVTTADANYFYGRPVETSVGLEGVVYARHRFVAVGDGLVLRSRDAVTWQGSAAPAGLRAIAFFNNVFVAASSDGSIATSADAVGWTTHPISNPHLLTAVAANTSTAIAVGFGGTILRSQATQAAPVVVTPPANTTEAVGNNVRLGVIATGTAPLAYQWNFEGRPLAGATNDTLPLRTVTAANAGHYTVTIKNALGSIASPAATLTIVDSFPEPADVTDPTFMPPNQRSPTALLPLPGGKILCANDTAIFRLLADGSPDATFTGPTLTSVTINSLALQADGKILASGSNGSTTYLVRLFADGTLDPAFAPPPNLPGMTATQVVAQPDGKILVANATSRLLRLNADGSRDTTFAAVDLAPLQKDPVPEFGIVLVALAPDGRIVVAAAPSTPGIFGFLPPPHGTAVVARLLANGALDPSFTPYAPLSNQAQLLSVLSDGRILFGSQYVGGAFGAGPWTVQRLNVDGSNDPTFLAATGYISKYGGKMLAGLDASGRITVVIGLNSLSPRFSIMRYQPDGTLDLTLRSADPFVGRPPPLKAIAVLPDGRTLISEDNVTFFRTVVTNASLINPPVALSDDSPPIATVTSGGAFTFNTETAGTGAFSYSWIGFDADRNYQSPYEPASSSVTFKNLRFEETVYATISNAAGTITYPAQVVRVPPAAPLITRAPASVAIDNGRYTAISFDAIGSGRLSYQWIFNGKVVQSGDLNAAVFDSLALPSPSIPGALQLSVTPETTGTYQLVLTNSLGTQTATVNVSLDLSSRLVDVSTRGFVGTEGNTLIAGFVVAGDTPKWVLIRGVGPGLAQFNLPNFLADPKLTLFDSTGAKLDENDDWVGTHESYDTSNWPATFAVAEGSHDAIISRRLPPGSYTAQVSGVNHTTGVALVEVYENIHDPSHLINLSTRVRVGTGAQIAISGVVVSGELPKKLLIRAAGPDLDQFGVTGTLADPSLVLFTNSGAVLASNNDWSATENKADLVAAAIKVGAFPFADGSKDSAMLVTVPPGSYTAQVAGANNGTGVALVEIYEVP